MKIRYLLVLMFCCNFLKANAEAPSINELKVYVQWKDLEVTDSNILLKTKNVGVISLNNLYFDESGYYSICKFSFDCAFCGKIFEANPTICDLCGSQDIQLAAQDHNKSHEFFLLEDYLMQCLTSNSFFNFDEMLCKGSVEGKVSKNDDGSASASAGFKYSNDDDSFTFEVDGGVRIDENGNTSSEATAKVRFNFKE